MDIINLVTLRPLEKEPGGFGGIDECTGEEEPSSSEHSPIVRKPLRPWQSTTEDTVRFQPVACWLASARLSSTGRANTTIQLVQWRQITIMGGGKHFASDRVR